MVTCVARTDPSVDIAPIFDKNSGTCLIVFLCGEVQRGILLHIRIIIHVSSKFQQQFGSSSHVISAKRHK